MARVLLGVSGGIAAYKALETVRLAIKAGHACASSRRRASDASSGRASFEGITGAPVLVSEFEPDPARGAIPARRRPSTRRSATSRWSSGPTLFLIAPATANTIAKLAAGLADNLLTTAALAAACPVVVAPAMNDRMYVHPATQANLGCCRSAASP